MGPGRWVTGSHHPGERRSYAESGQAAGESWRPRVLCLSQSSRPWARLGAQSWKEPRGTYLRAGGSSLRPGPSPLPGELGTAPDRRPARRCGQKPGRLTVFVQTGGGPAGAPRGGAGPVERTGLRGGRTVCTAPAAALKENAPSPSSESSRTQEHYVHAAIMRAVPDNRAQAAGILLTASRSPRSSSGGHRRQQRQRGQAQASHHDSFPRCPREDSRTGPAWVQPSRY